MILINEYTDKFEGNYEIVYVHSAKDVNEAKRFLINQYGSLVNAKQLLKFSKISISEISDDGLNEEIIKKIFE